VSNHALLALPLAVLLLSCSAADVPPTPPPPPPSAAPTAVAVPVAKASASAAPAVPEGVCSCLLAHNRELIAQSGAPGLTDPAGDGLHLAEACLVTPKGAWALRIDTLQQKIEPGGPPAAEGRFTVVHLPEGTAAAEAPEQFNQILQGFTSTLLEKPVLFDYDGDGEPELLLVAHAFAHEDASTTRTAIYTWKDRAVKLYPGLPAGVQKIEDLDKDGRPDLLYYPYSEVRSAACSGFDFRWDGPALVAHSLAGGAFSLDDQVARDHFALTCPPPRGKSKPTANSPTDSTLPEVCARLNGASEKDALRALQQACKKPKTPEEECQTPPGVCGDYREREKLIASIKTAPAAAIKGARKK
jgi:hypothetical protein